MCFQIYFWDIPGACIDRQSNRIMCSCWSSSIIFRKVISGAVLLMMRIKPVGVLVCLFISLVCLREGFTDSTRWLLQMRTVFTEAVAGASQAFVNRRGQSARFRGVIREAIHDALNRGRESGLNRPL